MFDEIGMSMSMTEKELVKTTLFEKLKVQPKICRNFTAREILHMFRNNFRHSNSRDQTIKRQKLACMSGKNPGSMRNIFKLKLLVKIGVDLNDPNACATYLKARISK